MFSKEVPGEVIIIEDPSGSDLYCPNQAVSYIKIK